MKAKILSGILLLALTLAAPYSAQASTRAIADTYTMNGLTYYNVNSPNFDSDKRFYVDAISAKHSVLGGHSLADLWLLTAVGIGKGDKIDPFHSVLSPTLRPMEYIDLMKQGILTGKIEDNDRYRYRVRYLYSAPAWNNDGGYVETSAWLDDYNGHWIRYAVRFSDFKAGALLPAHSWVCCSR